MSTARTKTRSPALSVRDAALAQIDGLAELDAAIEAADQIPDFDPQPVGGFNDEWEAALDRADGVVRAGKPIPTDIAEAAFRARYVPERLQLAAAIREQTIRKLAGERTTLFLRGADRALDHLADELNALLGDVLTFAEQGPKSVEILGNLADRYGEIRRAQLEITNRTLRERGTQIPGQLVASTGIYRDSASTAIHWVNRRADEAARSNPTTPAADAYVAWLRSTNDRAAFDPSKVARPGRVESIGNTLPPAYQSAPLVDRIRATEPTTSPWWPNTNRVNHLVEAARTDALWLPNTTDLIAAHTAAQAMTTRVVGKLYEQHTDARARYYDIIGLDDPEHLANDARSADIGPRSVSGQPLHAPRISGTRTR